MGPRSKRKRKTDATSSSNSSRKAGKNAEDQREVVKKPRIKKAVSQELQDDPLAEMEQQEEEWADMADVSGFSRFSIESIESLQDGEGLDSRGVTDSEALNASKEIESGAVEKDADEEDAEAEEEGGDEVVVDLRHDKQPPPKGVEKRVRLPSWHRGEPKGARTRGRGRAANMEKITGRQHPMVYEQQSYTNHLPVWEEDRGGKGRRVGGYLTYRDEDGEGSGQHESDENSDDAEGRGVWREVGYFNTADRRRLHGGYDEYLHGMDENSPLRAMQALPNDGGGVMSRRHMRGGRRMYKEDYSHYSLTAHALSSFLVFLFVLIAFLAIQWLNIFGSFYGTLALFGSQLLQLYSDIRTDSLPALAYCSTSVNLLKIAECEIQTAFNRLLRHSVDQSMQFVSLALKADNVPHVVALLLGGYTALKTLLWTVKQPVWAGISLMVNFLSAVYSCCLRTCEKSGI